jgi:hypothetical protein
VKNVAESVRPLLERTRQSKLKKPVLNTGDIKLAKFQGRNFTRFKDIMENHTGQDFCPRVYMLVYSH